MKEIIGFLGFGEAASNIAYGFGESKTADTCAYDVLLNADEEKRGTVTGKMERTGTAPCGSIREVMERARIIFLLTPAKFAKEAATEALRYMTKEHLFCDLTTNRPSVKEELGEEFAKRGFLYADASVMGAVPIYHHATPTLVSGNGAEMMLKKLSPLGMDLTFAGEEPGRAVKMKLTRSIFVKGIEALTMEMLMTARKLGIEKEIVEGIDKSFKKLGFEGFVGQLLLSGVIHDERRSVEAGECRELEEELKIDPVMMKAAEQKLKRNAELMKSIEENRKECGELEDLYRLWETSGII